MSIQFGKVTHLYLSEMNLARRQYQFKLMGENSYRKTYSATIELDGTKVRDVMQFTVSPEFPMTKREKKLQEKQMKKFEESKILVSDVTVGDYRNGHDIQTSHYTANLPLGWAGLYKPLQRISHMDKVIDTDINQVIRATPELVRRAVRPDLLKVYHQVKNK